LRHLGSLFRAAVVRLWVFFPGTLLGLCGVLLICITRAFGWANCHIAIVDGIIEASGPPVSPILKRGNRWVGPIAAITLGHVVLGASQHDLAWTRPHERVHVVQYERWGPLFIPAYLLSSVWLRITGTGHPYLDNPFEQEAVAKSE
jgi:hypothetical protein